MLLRKCVNVWESPFLHVNDDHSLYAHIHCTFSMPCYDTFAYGTAHLLGLQNRTILLAVSSGLPPTLLSHMASGHLRL